MVSVERVRAAMRAERRTWGTTLKTDYVKGILFGLSIALNVINRTHKQYEDEVLSSGHRRKECRKSTAFVQRTSQI